TAWFRDEAERVYMALGESPEMQTARHLFDVVSRLAARHGGRLTVRQFQRSHQRKYPTAESAAAALESLVGMGFGRWEAAPSGPKGGPPTQHFVPAVTGDRTDTTPWDDDPDDGPGPGGHDDTTPEPPSGGRRRTGVYFGSNGAAS